MTASLRSKIVRGVAIACVIASLAACQDRLVHLPTASIVHFSTLTSVVAVPSTDKPTIDAAADILSKRLRALGIENFSLSVGDTMVFDMTVPETVDRASIDAVLGAHGSIAFLSLPDGAADPVIGGPVPAGSLPIFDSSTEVTTATLDQDQNGQPVVDLVLGSKGAPALAAYTRAHIGDSFLLALDGKVVTSVVIGSPIDTGRVELSFADSPALSGAALTAIVASGPLPEAWPAN